MKKFYDNAKNLKLLSRLSSPTKDDLKKVLEIIRDDAELALYFYKELNSGWVELLDEAGEFGELREKETGMIGRYKAHYLKESAETKAEAVLSIIEKIEAQDNNIQGTLLRAIVEMPDETAIKGIGVVKKYLDGLENRQWNLTGDSSAELMIKLLANHPDKAFEIAETLLDAWVSDTKSFGKDIVAKFSAGGYSELVLKYYSKVWDANPERAIGVLIKILGRCIEKLDPEKDASSYFGYGLAMKDLDTIDMKHPDIKTVLVKSICKAGRVLVAKEPEKAGELLDRLEATKKVIFLRIAMYLLRFVKPGTEKERICRFVGNKEYFKSYNAYWNEHRWLLNDKFDDVSNENKKAFLEWVDEDKYDEELRQRITEENKSKSAAEPDFKTWENHAKAEELYLVRERFKDKYERYKNASGAKNDNELAPRKNVGEARMISPMEGTPLNAEDMAKMTCEEVLDYILKPTNYEIENLVNGRRTAKAALASTFGNDVKMRYKKYLKCDVNKCKKLPPAFLTSYFNEMDYVVREGSFNKNEWELLISFAYLVVEEKHAEQKYRNCFLGILFVLRDGFGRGKSRLELDESTAKKFLAILKKLVYFPVEKIDDEYERDPVQLQTSHVVGEALELTVLLGVRCKNNFSEYWEKELKDEIRGCWKYTLDNIREPGINCVFGLEFSRIHWLDTEWVGKNLESIFDDKLWDEIWGTYTSWGRPSPGGFKLLVEKGKYEQAVNKLGDENKFEFAKAPEEGLTEHLMIGYFNAWIDYDNDVLQEFFEKAPAELRAMAASFLATGFNDINEDGGSKKMEVLARMKRYWENRIAKKDKDEAVGFTKWVNDSVLDGKETLELLNQTLAITGGKLAEHRTKEFVEGVCKFGGEEGNEFLALQCFKKAAADKDIHMTWSEIQDPLVNFLKTMVDKSPDVRLAAKDVADSYGRYNPDIFRDVWEMLNKN